MTHEREPAEVPIRVSRKAALMPVWKEALRWIAIVMVVFGSLLALVVPVSDRLAIWVSAVVIVAVFTPVAIVLDNQRRAHQRTSSESKGDGPSDSQADRTGED